MWKSCVYKLTINNETYVGSTCNFKQRLNKHKHHFYNHKSEQYNKSLYKYIREHSEWDNVKVEILVHLHPKFNRGERCSFEQEWIDYLKPTLNDYKAYQTEEQSKLYKKQNYIDNKEQRKLYKKQYMVDNKDTINEKFNCECGGKYTRQHKSRHLKTKKHLKFM